MPTQQSPRVLCMEDDHATARLLQKWLERDGYSVELACDGAEGLEKCLAGGYDAIVVDYSMPELDGLEVIRSLASRRRLPPAIVLTATGSENVAVEVLKLGAADYLVKDVQGLYQNRLSAALARAMEVKRLEAALTEQREVLTNVLASIPHSVFWKDRHSVYLGCNGNFARDANLASPDEVVGKTDDDFAWKDRAAKYRRCDEHVMRTGEPMLNVEEPLWQGDREAIVLTSKASLHSTTGDVIGVLGVYVDITDRKRAEQTLHESEARFRTLVANIPGIVYRCRADRERTVEYISDPVEYLTGYHTGDFLGPRGRSLNSLIHASDAASVQQRIRDAITDKQTYALEYRVLRADGGVRWVCEQGQVVSDSTGEDVWLDGIILDVTERRMAEDALRNPDAILRNLYDQSHEAILFLAPDGFQYCNQAAARMFGHPTTDAFKRIAPHELSPPIQPSGLDSFTLAQQHIAMAAANGIHVFEWIHRRRDGTLFPAEVSLTKIHGGEDYLLHAFVRDLTQQKEAERQLHLDERRLDSLLTLSRMSDASLSDITTFVLEEAVALTHSKIGYLAFVDEAEGLLTIQQWSKVVMDQCEMADKPFVFRLEETGLWGEAVRQRKPLITNNYQASNPWKRELPAGHIPITRHMNVPVFDGERIVAVVGAGNKQEAYDDSDVRQLTLLMEGMWKHIQRKRNEEELEQYRNHLEELVQQRTADLEKAKESLRRERDFAEALIDNAQALVVLLDDQGQVVRCNRYTEELTGYSLPEVQGKSAVDIFIPEQERERVRAILQRSFNGDPMHGTICPIVAKDGLLREIQWYERVLRDQNGHVASLLTVGHDITERRRTEQELERKTQALALHVKQINCLHAISRLLEDGDLAVPQMLRQAIDLVPSAWQHSDVACARIMLDDLIFQTPNFTETLWRLAAPVIVEGDLAGAVEVCYLESRGEWPFLTEERDLILDIGQRLGKVIERRRVQARIGVLQRQIEYVLGATKTGLCITDIDGRLLYVDQAWQRIYGDPTGKTYYEYFKRNNSPSGDQSTAEAIKTRQAIVTDETLPFEDNRPVQVTTIPFQNEQGEWLIARVHVDVSRLKRLERELSQAQRLEAIGQLAAGIAHEINTPTQYIGDNTRFLGDAFNSLEPVLNQVSQLIDATRDSEATRSLLASVEDVLREADLDFLATEIPKAIHASLDGVDRVATIVRAMKEFSHPGGVQKQAVDLNRMIESTLTVSRNEWKYVAELETDFDPHLPLVHCYPSELNQVVLNVLINAGQAIGEVVGDGGDGKGKITVQTRRNGDWVEIRITDTGPGVPEPIRSKIFDPFFTTKDVGKGTGQGLALAYNTIVEKHHGTIHFETEVGAGTSFIIRLPLTATAKETADAHDKADCVAG